MATSRVAERDLGTVGVRHLSCDSEAEAAALGVRARQAIEAVEDARALRWRDARAVVLHDQKSAAVLGERGKAHGAARRRVADGVVDEVARKRMQRRGVASDRDAFEPLEAQLDPARLGERLELTCDLRGERVERNGSRLRELRLRLEARHGEHLLDWARRALHAGA